jgi:2-oxoisovalerate dehydrogenase E2 component (dihydrolipoyl transacylase)
VFIGEDDYRLFSDHISSYVNENDRISPAAKLYLFRHRIPSKYITPTGRKGMITKEDVLLYLKDPSKHKHKEVETKAPIKAVAPKSSFILSKPSKEDQVVKLDKGMKKRMSQVMAQSKSIPFFLYTDEYDVTNLLEFEQTNYPMMAMIIKAISVGLAQTPILNTVVNPDVDEDGYIHQYVIKKDHNISIAHSISEGLTIPNIPKVQSLKLSEIANLIPKVTDSSSDVDTSEESTFTLYLNDSGSNLYPNIIRPQT